MPKPPGEPNDSAGICLSIENGRFHARLAREVARHRARLARLRGRPLDDLTAEILGAVWIELQQPGKDWRRAVRAAVYREWEAGAGKARNLLAAEPAALEQARLEVPEHLAAWHEALLDSSRTAQPTAAERRLHRTALVRAVFGEDYFDEWARRAACVLAIAASEGATRSLIQRAHRLLREAARLEWPERLGDSRQALRTLAARKA